MTWEECVRQYPDLERDVRNYLDITWNDEATERKLRGFILSGIDRLTKLCGGGMDFGASGEAQSLLKEYCRYARDGAIDLFEINYRPLILSLQNERSITRYAQSQTAQQ